MGQGSVCKSAISNSFTSLSQGLTYLLEREKGREKEGFIYRTLNEVIFTSAYIYGQEIKKKNRYRNEFDFHL